MFLSRSSLLIRSSPFLTSPFTRSSNISFGSSVWLTQARRPFSSKKEPLNKVTNIPEPLNSKEDRSIGVSLEFDPSEPGLKQTDHGTYIEQTGKEFRVLSVDRSGLFRIEEAESKNLQLSQQNAKPGSPLFEHLKSLILYRGPISVDTYIRECLTNRLVGYYMNPEIFGRRGDFVTAPDISPMFSELIALWCLDCWHKLGKPKQLKIVECGPGTGNMMASILHTARKYADFYSSISVHLVEVSTPLKYRQAQTLQISLPPRTTEYPKEVDKFKAEQALFEKTHKTYDGLSVNWYPLLSELPEDGPFIFLCQEFFDALPVYLFQWTEKGWNEILVDVNHQTHQDFRLVQKQTGYHVLLKKAFPELQLVHKIDETIEVSPESVLVMEQISRRIEKEKGAALIIDYGQNGPSAFSLRGIKGHSFVSFLEEPGKVDISVDVNFHALSRTVKDSCSKTKVWGPVTQGYFLEDLGIQARLAKILKYQTDTDQVKALITGYQRLCSENEMGRIYKIMGLSNFPDAVAPHGF